MISGNIEIYNQSFYFYRSQCNEGRETECPLKYIYIFVVFMPLSNKLNAFVKHVTIIWHFSIFYFLVRDSLSSWYQCLFNVWFTYYCGAITTNAFIYSLYIGMDIYIYIHQWQQPPCYIYIYIYNFDSTSITVSKKEWLDIHISNAHLLSIALTIFQI